MRFIADILLLLVFLPLFTEGQTDQDYLRFKQQFDEEMAKTGNNKLVPVDFVVHPVTLPGWFTGFRQSPDGPMLTIGISDPGMNEEDAHRLAVLRAKAVAALIMNPVIQNLSENYSGNETAAKGENISGRFTTYSRFLSSFCCSPENVKELYYNFNTYNEAIVVLQIEKKGIGSDSIFMVADFYHAERNAGQILDMDKKLELFTFIKSPHGITGHFDYTIHAVNKKDEITSRYNNSEVVFPYRNYRYISVGDSVDTPANNPVKLTNGLWKSFIVSLLKGINLNAQDDEVTVKQVGDTYNSQRENITLESIITSHEVLIDQISVTDNQLSVALKSYNQN